MKNSLLFITLLLFTIKGFGQDPDLFKTWYLYSIEFESGEIITVANFDPPIHPDLIITETFDFNGFGACNTFEGTFNFTSPDGLEVISSTNTNLSCGFFENIFEDDYFGFFFEDTFMFFSIVTDIDDVQTLILHGGPFTTLTFREIPVLSLPEFNNNHISIYPNPTSEVLMLSSENLVIEKINIYSISGKLILEQKLNESNSINISGLSEGIYFLEVFADNGKSIQRFIKE